MKSKSPETGLVSVVLNNLAKPSPSGNRIKDPALAYGKRHWDDLLKDEFYAEHPGISSDDPHFLDHVRVFKRRKFDELPEEERLKWGAKVKQELDEQAAKLSNVDLEDRHSRANE